MAEMNRRTLAFRGGGGSLSVAAVNNNNNNGVSSEEEIAAWSLGRHLNGGGGDEEEVEVELEPEGLLEDEEEDGEAYPGAARAKAAAGGVTGPSVSGESSEEDEEEEEEEDEDGAGGKVEGDEDCALIQGEGPRRYGLLSSARSQSLLPSLHCSFQGSWLHEFPWLRFCQETGLMSCAWCHGNEQAGHDELTKGTRNYKRALLVRHCQVAEHRLNDPAAQESEIKQEVPDTYSDYSIKPNENSYCYQLLQELNDQRKKGILCDVNIVVNGKVFRAHKNILVAGSRFFKTLYCFTNKESRDQTTVTYLDVVAVHGFSVILDFMYSGNLVLTSQNAIEVMTVASYLQMTEVVQSCRNFIKDALNISIKSEAPDSVVVNYNKRKNKDGVATRDQKVASFWATRNLTNLASNAKLETDGFSLDDPPADNFQANDATWIQDSSPEVTEIEPPAQGKVFVWNDMASNTVGVPEVSKPRRKNQTTKRFVYNIPPNSELQVDGNTMLQQPVPYVEEDVQCFQDAAGTSKEFKFGMFPEPWPRETWENGDASSGLLNMNKLKCPHCNYVAKYRRTLKRHLLIHTGVRSFSCDICGKLFTRREHVKRHSLVHKKDKKYKCMVCKKIFMLAASVGIRHGSRRYGVCVDCVDKSQPGLQEAGVEQVTDADFPRDEEYDDNDPVETVDADDDLVDEGEDPNDHSRWSEQNDASRWGEQNDPSQWERQKPQPRWDGSGDVCMTIDD
ncbi:PREDICTED: zinc finger and BTB domain-containing protein 10 [Nanorana parkeri]|uniref:zinc finger and BTB domain-containing protein 10 n=1 Tax=Nanorana parkeri TaxID=125878 RepID=UPI000854AFA2|nr:PREDICTED: zinc finger and BTB domain-containing protein 10 [Nanorana parkeri]